MLTTAQLTTLKAAILAETDAAFVAARTAGSSGEMADWFNVIATPSYFVRRSSLSRHDILTGTSSDNTTFTWTGAGYITRSQGERDAFREMFNSTGSVNPWLGTIQSAFNDIFSGTGAAAVANRTHILAMSRREATRGEKVFAVGLGTGASPSVMGFEGDITISDIDNALRLV